MKEPVRLESCLLLSEEGRGGRENDPVGTLKDPVGILKLPVNEPVGPPV